MRSAGLNTFVFAAIASTRLTSTMVEAGCVFLVGMMHVLDRLPRDHLDPNLPL